MTAGQYTEFLNAVGGWTPTGCTTRTCGATDYGCKIQQSGGGIAAATRTRVAADFANRPVNYVSYWDDRPVRQLAAQRSADRRAGSGDHRGRGVLLSTAQRDDTTLLAVSRKADWKWAVTSEDEWYKAAYYKGGGTNAGYWDYPTSSDTAPGQDMADVSGNNANYYTGPYAYPIDSGKYTTSSASSRTPTARTARSTRAATFGSGTSPSCTVRRVGCMAGRSYDDSERPACLLPRQRHTRRTSTTMSGSAWQVFLSTSTWCPWAIRATPGELSGASYGGYGPDRICGAVDYTYNIGKYEVTAGQYTEFLNAKATARTPTGCTTRTWPSRRLIGCKIQRSGTSGSYTYSVASDWANRPVNYVSYWDAAGSPTGCTTARATATTETGAYTLNGYNGIDGRYDHAQRRGQMGPAQRGRVVQGGVPQERRRDGQLLGLSDDEQRQRAEQRL